MRQEARPDSMELRESILDAWRTNARTTAWLVEQLTPELWKATIPGVPTRSVRAIAAHLHNCRCTWVRTLGAAHGIAAPAPVDHRRVTQRQLLAALPRSADGIAALLELACDNDGRIPPSKVYVWRNLPLDTGHVLSYFAAHEAHHRGQIVLAARQSGMRLPAPVTAGLWQWTTRSREAARARR